MPSPGSRSEAQPFSTHTAAEEFSAFYRRNYQPALNLARCRAASADCEALVADSFLVTWQHYQLTGSLTRGWFYGVLRNKIGDFYRSARRRETSTSDFDAYSPTTDDPASGSDAHLDVLRVLQSLPAVHSEPLIMIYWCDLPGSEAATALGVREGTFRVRLYRAQRAFLKAYDQQNGRAATLEEVTPWTVQSD
jgi:RNA polymerase sigma-70 factor (ECF subfamily)